MIPKKIVMYHGTSSLFERSINRNGLIISKDSSEEYKGGSAVFLSSGILSAYIFSVWKSQGLSMSLEQNKLLPRDFKRVIARYSVVGSSPIVAMCLVDPKYLVELRDIRGMGDGVVFGDLYAFHDNIRREDILKIYDGFNIWVDFLKIGMNISVGNK